MKRGGGQRGDRRGLENVGGGATGLRKQGLVGLSLSPQEKRSKGAGDTLADGLEFGPLHAGPVISSCIVHPDGMGASLDGRE